VQPDREGDRRSWSFLCGRSFSHRGQEYHRSDNVTGAAGEFQHRTGHPLECPAFNQHWPALPCVDYRGPSRMASMTQRRVAGLVVLGALLLGTATRSQAQQQPQDIAALAEEAYIFAFP